MNTNEYIHYRLIKIAMAPIEDETEIDFGLDPDTGAPAQSSTPVSYRQPPQQSIPMGPVTPPPAPTPAQQAGHDVVQYNADEYNKGLGDVGQRTQQENFTGMQQAGEKKIQQAQNAKGPGIVDKAEEARKAFWRTRRNELIGLLLGSAVGGVLGIGSPTRGEHLSLVGLGGLTGGLAGHFGTEAYNGIRKFLRNLSLRRMILGY